ncbi:MAG: putative zinc-binding protein [Spirochaetaceae bacterium]|nr:MAG: putative zinc-binding protein [Spirochaetaceae bacterium]
MAEWCCGSDVPVKLLYACSGAANTGYLADNAARRLTKLGIGKMTCLAAMGGGFSGFVESAKAVEGNLVIDGCSKACGKKIFENLDIPFKHFVMTDFGVEKGKTDITSELIAKTTFALAEKIADE